MEERDDLRALLLHHVLQAHAAGLEVQVAELLQREALPLPALLSLRWEANTSQAFAHRGAP